MKIVIAILVLLGLSSCSAQVATCHLRGTAADEGITGVVTFTQVDDLVEVEVQVEGITVGADIMHGIHIHQYGDLSSTDGLATGTHWGAITGQHGCPDGLNNETRHYGDLGNWQVTAGAIDESKMVDIISLTGEFSVVGYGMILHAATDDCADITSSGARLAQCVIGIVTDSAATSGAVDAANAVCELKPTDGNDAYGRVYFKNVAGGVDVKAVINNITGTHGIHVHQWGDLSLNTGLSTGGHYNPDDNPHALPGVAIRHVGDMGNVYHYDNGVAYYHYVNDLISLTGPQSIIGRAVILHANEDDCGQPVGNAGSRYAQCVIGYDDAAAEPADFPATVPTTQDFSACPADTTTTTTATTEENSSALIAPLFALLAAVALLF